MSEEWQAIRCKAQGTSAHNKNPHLLSRGGYRKLEEKIVKQKADAIPPSQGGSPPQPPSPPSRHEKWKLARMRPSGTYSSDTAREISEKITHAQEKIPLSEDDPLSSLHLLADILDDNPLEVEYDANVFGTGSEVPIYLNSQDVRELASGTQELNISIIQLWTMYMSGVSNKLGRSDDYGFIDPQSIHESNDFEHINMSLIRSFGRGKKIYFLPYISGRHWQLLVMFMQDNYALWFCSLHRPPPTQLKQAIDCSIPASMMMGGRSIVNSRKIAWISLKV
ncbi:hypothetical protein LR48_Vigan04g007400 [Vigna angularis]|uniref:Ubiquitin-like protease family profile domain-containing protein n=1 Tax=Phaseolus angularis TaxID=3914 RepID=A0A0L9UAZ4_PHAAN|nr:hypothetical protein LR48_Vigan04g007400 [Vigna angularis]